MTLLTHSAAETQSVGEVLGRKARAGDLFLLVGDLGAGKTCLTQGIARGLGVAANVRSPSFVIATRYAGRLDLHHVDLYRIERAEEAWDLGLDDILGAEGVCVVEWADRAPSLFPADSLWVHLQYGTEEHQRVIRISQAGSRYDQVLKELEDTFDTNEGPDQLAAGH